MTSDGKELKEGQAEFEKFLVEKHLNNEKDKDVWDNEMYKYSKIDAMWYAWQYCWNTRPPPSVPEVGDWEDNFHKEFEYLAHRDALIFCDIRDFIRQLLAKTPGIPGKAAQKPEPQYPCDKCGKLRTKAEGGTTFTVCDECWDKELLK